MISDPDSFFEEFVDSGSDSFLVHWEGNNNLHRTVHRIKDLGRRVGVALNPATPAAVLEEILPDLDLVVVMTVNPGFGHQHFLRSTLPKIERVRQMVARLNSRCEVEALMRQRRRRPEQRELTPLSPDRRFLAIMQEWPRP